jgi:hypothetical protein
MSEYFYKGNVYCDAECAIKALTGKSTNKVGFAWDADVVLEIIGVAMKLEPGKTHSDVFPQVLADDVQGNCAVCKGRVPW